MSNCESSLSAPHDRAHVFARHPDFVGGAGDHRVVLCEVRVDAPLDLVGGSEQPVAEDEWTQLRRGDAGKTDLGNDAGELGFVVTVSLRQTVRVEVHRAAGLAVR